MRYRIVTLFSLTAVAAVAYVLACPFQPKLTAFETVDLGKRHPYDKLSIRYEVAVVNTGTDTVWVPDNELPAFDMRFNTGAIPHLNGTYVNVDFNDRELLKLDPSRGVVYTMYIAQGFDDFGLLMKVQDWRGREADWETRVKRLPAEEPTFTPGNATQRW